MRRLINRHESKLVGLCDPICLGILLFITGFLVIYELYYILPHLCDTRGLAYKLNHVLAFFLTFNILGNIWCCRRTDTSLEAVSKIRQHPPLHEAHLWRLCTHCQMLMPPRSWHCRRCKKCVLKRDHHCNFLCTCIGFTNQRYFVALLLHLTVGCFFSLLYNGIFLWQKRMLIVNEPMIFFGNMVDKDPEQLANWYEYQKVLFHMGIFKLLTLVTAGPCVHFFYQLYMLWRGTSMGRKDDRSYDLGGWQNLRLTFGHRMWWVFLSPFLKSKQPHDGTQWQLAPQSI
ncbi:probable palmitoyltransferase ZDHHC24 [Scaptodrosophila lebanonensis]|uniref:Palmitoyltransferase n=1 Tax=Drosophila lebanonensis TaxID=7225 RepID=A0A6J2THN9_DROLE|nr:probable palmitoyltransferase ZDHHC24 [Scaptodrosophila lebanonensis]